MNIFTLCWGKLSPVTMALHTLRYEYRGTQLEMEGIAKQSSPATRHIVANGERCSSYSFLTSALNGVSGHCHPPAELNLRKEPRYSLDMSLGGHQSWSGHRGKRKTLLPLPGNESLFVQSVVRHSSLLTELPKLLDVEESHEYLLLLIRVYIKANVCVCMYVQD
jgi:hypothetical protein